VNAGPSFDMTELVRDNPDETAELLESLGATADDLAEYVYARTGFVRFPR
jgi:hypothetical protein